MREPPSLAVSIVTFAPALSVLEQTLSSLASALAYARKRAVLGKARLLLVDNGPGPAWRARLRDVLAGAGWGAYPDSVRVLSGHGNVGYGAGNNLAIGESGGDFHLILNPDVSLEQDALYQALVFMAAHPDVGLLTPAARDGEGNTEYLCKRYPSLFDLLLRGFAPAFLRRRFAQRLERYELRDLIADRVVLDVPIVSGCFMLFRRPVLDQLKGFSPAYFLYFEDFDLSLRTAGLARIAYVPAVRIEHLGGDAAGKGWRHIGMFLRSAVTFFHRNGWKWL